ncbi:MAG: Ig-like domain-containing protein [Anaerolineae bacterium]|nr:Ig-like domain-containing protein [Anaerolineae bacterium]
MTRKPLVLLIALLALSVGLIAIVPAVRSAGEVAPQVIDTMPVRGEELPIDGSISFYFDQPMDKGSVETNFQTEPAIAGTFAWQDDQTLTFKPNAALERATEYSFRIGGGAKNTAGTPIRDTFVLKLRTIGFLDVAQIVPADKTNNVEATPTITVIFNRPVVPLLPVEEMNTLPSPIKIDPPAEGKGEWVNTSIYTFKPMTPLVGGTQYTITVSKGLTDVTGSVLQNDIVTTFTTISPTVIEIQPDNNRQGRRLDQKVTVVFSQPMDRASTEQAFILQGQTAGKPTTRATGKFEWSDDNLRFTFTLRSAFE